MHPFNTIVTMTETTGGRFRLAAIAEAWSWVGLLTGMCFKYLVVHNPIGVQLMGPIHGALFILYLVATIQCAKEFRWSAGTTAIAIAASIPPLATWPFERIAAKRGWLTASRTRDS